MKSLNNEDGFWAVEDRRNNSTWEFGTPGKSVIISPDKYWVTNATGYYKSDDQSYVNSPCMDLTAYTKPSISINYWYNTDPGKDGAVLQYSIDGGASWVRLGNLSTGLNWYNEQGISAGPGGQNLFGWSGKAQSAPLVGKHALSSIVGQPGASKTRLRIAFASDAKDTLDGFAFNDVNIEERNRFTLVENFTNTAPSIASIVALNNTAYNAVPISESVKIQYHTSFPGDDDINKANPGDHDARSAYYGLTKTQNLIPRGYIDGANQPALNNQADFTMPWASNYLPLRSLVSSPITITISNPAAANNELAVTVSIKALQDITSGKPKLYVGIVEKQLGSLEYVMRKMLPSASGTPLTLPIAKDAIIPFTLDPWEVKNVTSVQELAIIAFVQDEETKDVLQSSIFDKNNPLPNLPTTITGVELSQQESISIFPNPANNEFRIQLPLEAPHQIILKLVDQVGRVVHESSIAQGASSKTVGTHELAGGVYILQVDSGKGDVIRKKLMVVHTE